MLSETIRKDYNEHQKDWDPLIAPVQTNQNEENEENSDNNNNNNNNNNSKDESKEINGKLNGKASTNSTPSGSTTT